MTGIFEPHWDCTGTLPYMWSAVHAKLYVHVTAQDNGGIEFVNSWYDFLMLQM